MVLLNNLAGHSARHFWRQNIITLFNICRKRADKKAEICKAVLFIFHSGKKSMPS